MPKRIKLTKPFEIKSNSDFEKLLKISYKSPVIILKFSPICPISFFAENQFNEYLKNAPQGLKAYTIDVINAKAISSEIAKKAGVTHKSPQALFIRNGKCQWHDSHSALKVKEFEKQISNANGN